MAMDMERIVVKRNVKDSVFTDLFRDKKYLLQLYLTLHPEDSNVTEDDIQNVTLKNILTDNLYNDLGFTVGNRMVVLVEAQSTWTVNILVRGLMYLVQTYQEYIDKTNQNVYISKPLRIPKPELYVIYTGDKMIEKEYISLKEEFFGNSDSCAIDVRVKILTESGKRDIINQYITFTKVCTEQIRLHGRTETAVREIFRICKDENVLAEYLSAHETEVSRFMIALFDDEKIMESFIRTERYEAEEAGRQKGIKEGIKEGQTNLIAALRKMGIDEATLQKAAAGTE